MLNNSVLIYFLLDFPLAETKTRSGEWTQPLNAVRLTAVTMCLAIGKWSNCLHSLLHQESASQCTATSANTTPEEACISTIAALATPQGPAPSSSSPTQPSLPQEARFSLSMLYCERRYAYSGCFLNAGHHLFSFKHGVFGGMRSPAAVRRLLRWSGFGSVLYSSFPCCLVTLTP